MADNPSEGNQMNVIPLRSGTPLVLSKKQLAARLDRSTRWIELKVAEGMPALQGTDRFGGKRFDVGAVEAWLASGNPGPRPDRVALLEARIHKLEERLNQ